MCAYVCFQTLQQWTCYVNRQEHRQLHQRLQKWQWEGGNQDRKLIVSKKYTPEVFKAWIKKFALVTIHQNISYECIHTHCITNIAIYVPRIWSKVVLKWSSLCQSARTKSDRHWSLGLSSCVSYFCCGSSSFPRDGCFTHTALPKRWGRKATKRSEITLWQKVNSLPPKKTKNQNKPKPETVSQGCISSQEAT